MTLQAKLLRIILPIVTVISLVLGYVFSAFLFSEYKNFSVNEGNILLRQLESAVTAHFDAAERQLALVADNDAVRKQLTSSPGDRHNKEIVGYLNHTRQHYKDFKSIYVFDLNGTILAAIGDGVYQGHHRARAVAQTMKNQGRPSLRTQIFNNGQTFTAYGRSVLSDPSSGPRETIGFIIVLEDFDYFDGLVSKAIGFEDNFVVIASKTNIVRNPNGLPFLKTFLGGLKEESFFQVSSGSVPLGESDYLYCMIPLERGYSIISFSPAKSFRTMAIRSGVWVLAACIAISILISVAVLAFINQLVVRRLKKIEMISNQVASDQLAGNSDFLDSHIVEDDDEIGRLQTSVMDMLRSIFADRKMIDQLAYFDELTHLPNRRRLNSFIREEISAVDQHNNSCASNDSRFVAAMMMDLDDFKEVNDVHGHFIGDDLLREISKRLTAAKEDVHRSSHGQINIDIFRLAGDEFTVIAGGLRCAREAEEIAQSVVEAFQRPFQFDSIILKNSVSIGVAIYPTDADDRHSLLKHADMAMYEAKSSGKNSYRFFDVAMNERIMQRKEMERKIIQAVTENEFQLFYQPKYCVDTDSVYEFEALIRWNHAIDGWVSPQKFIPFAEENGLISIVSNWVVNQLCADIATLESIGWTKFKISFNASPQQLQDVVFTNTIMRCIERHQINPAHLEMEITEYSFAKEIDETIKHLNRIRAMGVSVAIDDFGTGYSSLSYLEKLPIDTLKIDRSFIRDAQSSASKVSIIKAIVTLARGLGMKTVAEGVETKDEFSIAKEQGCNFVQGYFCHRPMTLNEAIALRQ